jgi:hypothetical protein
MADASLTRPSSKPNPKVINYGAFTQPGEQQLESVFEQLQRPLTLVTSSGVIDPHTARSYMITKAGVAALTLAAPTAGSVFDGGDDGLIIDFVSNTADQHTITATGLFEDGAGHVNVATFPANIGGGLRLMAYAGKWFVVYNNNVVMS